LKILLSVPGAKLAGNRHETPFPVVAVLTMTPTLSSKLPTIPLPELDHVSDLREPLFS